MKSTLPTTEYVQVTPQIAAEWLKSNIGNRKVSDHVVEAYAADMRAGAWRTTHQGIAFDAAGRLLDGQHRLLAVVKAGFQVTMAVTRGLQASAQEVLDAQKPRSVSDQLQLIDGLPNANKFSGAARVIYELDNGKTLDKATLNIIRSVLAKYKDAIGEMLRAMRGTEFDSVVLVGPLAYALAADKGKIITLANQIRSGESLRKPDAAYQIREWVRKYGVRRREEAIMMTLRGAYAHLHGEQLHHFRATELARRDSEKMNEVIGFFRIANET